jgi:hypothetical protein
MLMLVLTLAIAAATAQAATTATLPGKSNPVPAVAWQKSYFDDKQAQKIVDVALASDGGYVILGTCMNNMMLVKTDAQGNLKWKMINNTPNAYTDVVSIKKTKDNGFIVCGVRDPTSFANSQALLIKYDAKGNQQWYSTYPMSNNNQAFIHDVALAPDGGYLLVGSSGMMPGYLNKVYLLKTDAKGVKQWEKTIDDPSGLGVSYGPMGCGGNAVTLTSDGYVIAGTAYYLVPHGSLANRCAGFLLKIDFKGNIVWRKAFTDNQQYSLSGPNIMFNLVEATTTGFIAAGSYGDSKGVYIVKTDTRGNLKFGKIYNTAAANTTTILSIVPTFDGGFAFTGYTNDDAHHSGGKFAYLCKVGSSGNLMWSKVIDSYIYSTGNWVRQTSDSGYMLFMSVQASPAKPWGMVLEKYKYR